MSKIIYRKESYRIVGACFEVYKDKGCGFNESVYQECLEIEFRHSSIPFASQPKLELSYREESLTQYFRPDFVCFDSIILEIKAVSKCSDIHRGQTLNYLKASRFQLAILVNFGHYPRIEYERFGNQDDRRDIKKELANWQNRK